ncbi:MAG: hypothetical protein JWR12_963 [Mucilaginibacter sp.]|nr:hypothetical protein [Mucilaginibacter sp.]
MVREIIVPDKNKVSVVLPDDYIGKTIEVIAFVLDESVTKSEIFSPTFNALKIDTLNHPFNREEANER